MSGKSTLPEQGGPAVPPDEPTRELVIAGLDDKPHMAWSAIPTPSFLPANTRRTAFA